MILMSSWKASRINATDALKDSQDVQKLPCTASAVNVNYNFLWLEYRISSVLDAKRFSVIK